jgi:bacterioferritin
MPNNMQAPNTPFVSDVRRLRKRAREHIEQGAVTDTYGLDAQQVCKVLNDALATEIVCVLPVPPSLLHGLGHPLRVGEGGVPRARERRAGSTRTASPSASCSSAGARPHPAGLLSRSHSEYVEGKTLRDMLREDLVAERIAIDSYREIVTWLQGKDSTTRRIMEEILAKEEEHAEDLASLLAKFPE